MARRKLPSVAATRKARDAFEACLGEKVGTFIYTTDGEIIPVPAKYLESAFGSARETENEWDTL